MGPHLLHIIVICGKNKHWVSTVSTWKIEAQQEALSSRGNENICTSSHVKEFVNKIEYEDQYSAVHKSALSKIFINNSINIIGDYWQEEIKDWSGIDN